MSGLVKVEYRVRKRTVYFVTRYCQFGDSVDASEEGEFSEERAAYRAAESLCITEARHQGIAEDDPRLIYPEKLNYPPLPASPT